MKPPARSVVGNLVWSADGGGVWAVWRVAPLPHAHTSVGEKLSVHAQLRGLMMSLPADSMLLSICERLDPVDVVERIADGIDLEANPAWDAVCGVSAEWLGTVALRRRRYYVVAALNSGKPSWRSFLEDALGDVNAAFGLAPRGVPGQEVVQMQRQAKVLHQRLGQHGQLSPVTAGELCWIYARSLRREIDEPTFHSAWEPPIPEDLDRARNDLEAAEGQRPRGVLAHLTDLVVKEGGFPDDEGRPRHRRYVRVDHSAGTAYQTVLALSDMPHYFRYPGGGGEWLYHVDRVGFPVDWCVRIRSVPNAEAQAKVRRKQRDLIGQVEEYDGEVTGAPPQLADAIRSIDTERAELGGNPAEPELQVTVLMSIAAPDLHELEERAGALQAMYEPEEYGVARPTGGQVALLRSMLPGTSPGAVCRDYTQFMLTRDLAAGAPFCGSDVGDPQGLLLGVSLDDANGTPVLFDPAYGPQVNASPSLAAVGRLGSGKSYFLKRLCWDTVARGGQVVTIDRTHSGEYARLGAAMPGRVQVVHLEANADTRLDPLTTFVGDQRATVTLGFLSLLAGCSAHSEEGAALAEAVDEVVENPQARLIDVLDCLARMGDNPKQPDAAARGLARRLRHYAHSPTGQLAFGAGQGLTLDADFIVFWAPNLTLPDRETLTSDSASRLMLPEQVLGQALLYLVAAVGRQVVFRDPTRFAAALYDEAWALLASPHGQNLLIEGVRDGRKHNGAIWLASQHPNDFAVSELADLLGSKFIFRQARQAIQASLEFLGADDSMAAAATLEQGLETGVCFYRDVRDRVGLIQVLPPALPELDEVFNTAPSTGAEGALTSGENVLDDDVVELDSVEEVPELGPVAAGALEAGEYDDYDEPDDDNGLAEVESVPSPVLGAGGDEPEPLVEVPAGPDLEESPPVAAAVAASNGGAETSEPAPVQPAAVTVSDGVAESPEAAPVQPAAAAASASNGGVETPEQPAGDESEEVAAPSPVATPATPAAGSEAAANPSAARAQARRRRRATLLAQALAEGNGNGS